MLALDLETLDQIFTFRVMLPPRTAFHNILTGPVFSYLPRWDSCYPATFSSQGDRMAMAHSVEGRYPFLDHRVVRFAPALPPRLKMKVLNAKYLLKRSAAGLVPERIPDPAETTLSRIRRGEFRRREPGIRGGGAFHLADPARRHF